MEGRNKVSPPLFSEAVELFKRELESEAQIKPQSKRYRLWCLQKIERSWPALWALRLDEMSNGVLEETACQSSRTLSREVTFFTSWARKSSLFLVRDFLDDAETLANLFVLLSSLAWQSVLYLESKATWLVSMVSSCSISLARSSRFC